MNEKQLKERARRHHPKVPYLRHALTAFVSGGLVGVLGQGLLVMYQSVFRMQESDALTMMSVSVMGVAALATAFGWYDKLAQKCGPVRADLRICQFAHRQRTGGEERGTDPWHRQRHVQTGRHGHHVWCRGSGHLRIAALSVV